MSKNKKDFFGEIDIYKILKEDSDKLAANPKKLSEENTYEILKEDSDKLAAIYREMKEVI